MADNGATDGIVPKNDDYVSRTGQKQANVPVASDDDIQETEMSREQADSDAQLGSSRHIHPICVASFDC